MKELMENGPVQGKHPSSSTLVPEAYACLRLGTMAQTSPPTGSAWREHLEPCYGGTLVPGHTSIDSGTSACANELSGPNLDICLQPSWRCMKTSSYTREASTATHQ